MFPGNELGPSHNKLSHPGSWTDLRKAGKKNFLSTEDLWVSPSAARVALGLLWAQEGNCEWSFKAPDLGRSLDTWFPEMTVLEISRSWGWLCSEEEGCFWQSSWQAVAKDVQWTCTDGRSPSISFPCLCLCTWALASSQQPHTPSRGA